MSISSISSASSALATPQVLSTRQQEDVAGRQLEQALQSGDLAGAQQAYNTLSSFGSSSSGPFVNPTLAKDFAAVGAALQSGDLGGAQQAIAQLGTNLLQHDAQIAQQDYKNGNLQAAQQAVTNLEGDYWAVTGQGVLVSPGQNTAPATAANQASSAINVQA